jgi:hypothetical protein
MTPLALAPRALEDYGQVQAGDCVVVRCTPTFWISVRLRGSLKSAASP